jgi:hypothetical protein
VNAGGIEAIIGNPNLKAIGGGFEFRNRKSVKPRATGEAIQDLNKRGVLSALQSPKNAWYDGPPLFQVSANEFYVPTFKEASGLAGTVERLWMGNSSNES